ncbi:MAG TPA: GNAT family N-acetyltransferase [Acidimicrobiia bacterium]|nr:GNAT family N-acetyltransferase [Acidimicrobiia bacterium]
MTALRYVRLTPDLVEQCAALELRSFPTADPDELLSADDIAAYAETFPEGFFVCLDGDRVVGQGAGIFLDFDFDDYQHSIVEITGEHQCGNHDPDADWYYGTDIVVDPDYRRRGIGRTLYDLRKQLVMDGAKHGIIAGGHMHGFVHHKHAMTADEYITEVREGRIYDPTLTFQMNQGFELVGGLENYLADEATDGWSALIVWRNPRLATRTD